jgi:hypothetical protein
MDEIDKIELMRACARYECALKYAFYNSFVLQQYYEIVKRKKGSKPGKSQYVNDTGRDSTKSSNHVLGGGRKEGVHMESLLEEFFLAAGTPNFKFNFCPVRPAQMEMDGRAGTAAPHTFDGGKVRPVQSVGDAENRCKLQNNISIIGAQFGEPFVFHLRMALPVVPGNVCDDFLFVLGEAEKFRITDEVVRMPVVLGVRDK